MIKDNHILSKDIAINIESCPYRYSGSINIGALIIHVFDQLPINSPVGFWGIISRIIHD